MKNFKILVICVICATSLISCRFTSSVTRTVPMAINTVNSVRLNELNLERKDYTILKTITAEAVVLYREDGDDVYLEEESGEFTSKHSWNDETGWKLEKHTGIARFGFLSNDYDNVSFQPYPGYVVRNLAIYRAINTCKLNGADGLIEPVISMSVEERKDRKVAYKATVTAKLLKLKTDK